MKFSGFLQKNALVLIMVLYLFMATAGIFFNYSLFNTTGDEAPLLSATLKMIADRGFRPNYPTFYHLGLGAYLYLPFFLVFLIWLRLSGLFASTEALKQFGQIEFAKLLPLARFISALSGLVCLYLLYKICEKLFRSRFISLLAAFFLAMSLLFVQASHFARIWVPQVMTILLAFYFIICLYQAEKVKIKNYLWAGFGLGLAFGTHVVGVFVYASFLAVHYLKNKRQKFKAIILDRYFWLANGLFAIMYFIAYYLNTYGFSRYLGGVFPNLNKMHSLSDSYSTIADRASSPAQGGNIITRQLLFYLDALWQNEPILLLAAIFGSVILFKKRRDIFLVFYSFILVYFFAISSLGMRTARYLLPVLPLAAIFAAYGLAWLYGKIRHKKTFVGAVAVLCLAYLYPALLWDYKFLAPASRLEAANWVYGNLAPDESIINLDAHLELNENRQSLKDLEKYSSMLTKKRAFLLNSPDEVFPRPNYYIFFYPHYQKAPPEIINKKFNYLIISWLDKKDYDYWLLKLNDLNLAPKNLSLVKRFPASADLDDIGADLGGDIVKPLKTLPKLKQNGPIVDIYKIIR